MTVRPDAAAAPPVRPRRTITGMSAVLLPFAADGDGRLGRVRGALGPHGRRRARPGRQHGHRLRAAARRSTRDAACSTSRRRRRAGGVRRRRVRRRRAGRTRSTRRLRRGRSTTIADRGRHAGGLPVARAQRARRRRLGRAPSPRSADRSTGSSASSSAPMFVPVRPHLLARRVPRAARRSPQCIGAKHSSLSAAGWSGTGWRCATRCGPTSWCSPATTSRSTW